MQLLPTIQQIIYQSTSPPLRQTHTLNQNYSPEPAPQSHSYSEESRRKDSDKLDGGSFYYLQSYLSQSYYISIFEILDFRFSKFLIFDYRNSYPTNAQSLDAPLFGRWPCSP